MKSQTHGEMLDGIGRMALLLGSTEKAIRISQENVLLYANESGNASPALHHTGEVTWRQDGCPSYQVSPELCLALQKTNLDLDVAHVRLPHRAFALELPLEGHSVIRDPVTGRRLLALLVAAVSEPVRSSAGGVHVGCFAPSGEDQWVLLLVQRWEDEDLIDPVWFLSALIPGTTVANHIEKSVEQPFHEHSYSKGDQGVRPTPEVSWTMVKLALGASLFAVGANHRFTRPLKEPKAKRKRRERAEAKGREPDPQDSLVRRWSLGTDIQLPGGSGTSNSDDQNKEEPSRHLQWAHLRQGHLRMQRVGSRDQVRYEIRYIAPTVVRPDLEFPEGYRATKHGLDLPR